jgi:uncharacterized RDD family membrane protein YckC
MKSKFEPDSEDGLNWHPAEVRVDPEAHDANEGEFAAGLQKTSAAQAKFVVEEQSTAAFVEEAPSSNSRLEREALESPEGIQQFDSTQMGSLHSSPAQPELLTLTDPEAWRREVAAKLDSFRSRRRPKAPLYPSLRLKFEPGEPAWSSAAGSDSSVNRPTSRQAITVESALPNLNTLDESAANSSPVPAAAPEVTGRIIEFPRSANTPSSHAPPRRLEELADPVVDKPRILEAPDLAFPPPALGGILIEPVEVPANERRPGFEIPLQSAPLVRRLAAAAVDAVIVLIASAGFAYLVFKITNTIPPLPLTAETAVLVVGLLWAGYQYLSLVHTGTTPGLKIAKLHLSLFDGNPVPHRLRRWRVLASILSGMSLGLGYAWCFLDEDQLCWHDRITRTYMAPTK